MSSRNSVLFYCKTVLILCCLWNSYAAPVADIEDIEALDENRNSETRIVSEERHEKKQSVTVESDAEPVSMPSKSSSNEGHDFENANAEVEESSRPNKASSNKHSEKHQSSVEEVNSHRSSSNSNSKPKTSSNTNSVNRNVVRNDDNESSNVQVVDDKHAGPPIPRAADIGAQIGNALAWLGRRR